MVTITSEETRRARKLYDVIGMAYSDARLLQVVNQNSRDKEIQHDIDIAYRVIDEAHTAICGLMAKYYS